MELSFGNILCGEEWNVGTMGNVPTIVSLKYYAFLYTQSKIKFIN